MQAAGITEGLVLLFATAAYQNSTIIAENVKTGVRSSSRRHLKSLLQLSTGFIIRLTPKYDQLHITPYMSIINPP